MRQVTKQQKCQNNYRDNIIPMSGNLIINTQFYFDRQFYYTVMVYSTVHYSELTVKNKLSLKYKYAILFYPLSFLIVIHNTCEYFDKIDVFKFQIFGRLINNKRKVYIQKTVLKIDQLNIFFLNLDDAMHTILRPLIENMVCNLVFFLSLLLESIAEEAKREVKSECSAVQGN